jgi:surface protein
MFNNCSSLENIEFQNFETENVENMNSVFEKCISLKSLNIDNFKTNKLTTMKKMFFDCESLNRLYLPYFDTKNIDDDGLVSVFDNCTSLNLFIDLDKCSNLIIPEYVNVTDI